MTKFALALVYILLFRVYPEFCDDVLNQLPDRFSRLLPAAVIVEIHIDDNRLELRLSFFFNFVEKRNRDHRFIQNFRRKWFLRRVALRHLSIRCPRRAGILWRSVAWSPTFGFAGGH